MKFDFLNLIDFYKADHRRQYPPGTRHVYSNMTARASRTGVNEVVFFGLQYFLEAYLTELAEETFFRWPRSMVLKRYRSMLDGALGGGITTEHIEYLHSLGHLPLEVCALSEGTRVPLRVPYLTIENTDPECFWLTNYIESLISSVLWQPITSATTAYEYRKLLDRYAARTSSVPGFVDWQAHDFSFRGMAGPEAAALSGAGHLLSFFGTDSAPAIQLLRQYYDGDTGTATIGGSVPATEHSVMCAGRKDDEYQTFIRLLQLYPAGVVSIVSDTWDLWNVITGILPAIKGLIMERDGKLVIRPDSGDPVKILTGDDSAAPSSPQGKGVIQLLWEIFGGQVNLYGYKELDSHIGAIYGDSITIERASQICARLAAKGFASTNVVLGVGSFTYQYVTRDTYGQAVKATWADVNGEPRLLQKDPVTDDGTKKSSSGRLVVTRDAMDVLQLHDSFISRDMHSIVDNLLQPVWRDGKFIRRTNLHLIRNRLLTE